MIQDWFKGMDLTDMRAVASILVLFLLYVIRLVFIRIVNSKVTDVRSRYAWRQSANYGFFFIALIVIVRVWFEWFQSVITLLSVIAAALTIVSKEILLNFMSYGIIIWRGLFDVGDRIQIGNIRGDVLEIGPSYITLGETGNWVHEDETTGHRVKVPNAQVLTQPVANFSKGMSLIWNEVTMEMPVHSNWRKAKAICQEQGKLVSHSLSERDYKALRNSKEELMFLKTDPTVYLNVHDNKISLTIRYLCKFHKRRSTEQRLWEALLTKFESHPDIHFAEKSKKGGDGH